MSRHNGHEPPDPDEQQQRAQEQQVHGAAVGAAGDRAARSPQVSLDPEQDDIVETLFSPGIGRDEADLPDGVADDLEPFLSAEFGRHVGLGNITREEYQREKKLDKARALLAMQGFRRRGRSGSECTGETRDIMLGEDDPEKPLLTPDRARQIRAAFSERSMLRSLSINARGWRGVTEFIGSVRTESGDIGESDDAGILSSITSKLP